jgi:hypothetical protein
VLRRASLAALAVLAFALPAQARVVTAAQVRYATQDGDSAWQKTEVTLMKGSELNKATRTYDYSGYDTYALIWFSQDQVAIIHIEGTIFGCGHEFEVSCIPRYGNMEGNDQGGRKWEICTAQYC